MSEQLAQYTPQVYRLALRLSKDRHLAEDLTQETMLRACRNFENLRSPDQLVDWLLRITVNLWRDELRLKRRRPQQTVFDDVASNSVSVEDQLLNVERLQTALAAMDSLPERQRTVLHLFAVEKMALARIANVLGITVNNAKVNLFHARRAMQQKFKPDEPLVENVAPTGNSER